MSFRLTYATMFDPPEAMHERFDAALAQVRAKLAGGSLPRHELFIAGRDAPARHYVRRTSPIDSELVLGEFAVAEAGDVDAAMRAAAEAFPGWRAKSAEQRIAHVRRIGELLEERVYPIAAALSIEVGKNRMEALGEAQETVDFFSLYADDYASHHAYENALPNDPLPNVVSRNHSSMRPYGVWGVISPFNFPLALAGGPVAAALVTGNTVVLKGSSETPWAVRLLADCIRDAGLPPGVFNCLSGSGGEIGAAIADDPRLAGLTFTGSARVGGELIRKMASGRWPRPCIAEMGGKNPCIVTARADLDRAAAGIVRSAYGLSGQKCSALSRLYVESGVADALLGKLETLIDALRIGDPTQRANWLGPVIHERAYAAYQRHVAALRAGGATIRRGGDVLASGALARGTFVTPVLAEAPLEHPLWQEEMFLPILMVHRCADREEAMRLANRTDLGLSAGFYGAAGEVAWFQEHIEAGVTYANRPQGATTGAWPGYQPFAGWKGSSSGGKAIASFYYLAQYLREQSRTVVD